MQVARERVRARAMLGWCWYAPVVVGLACGCAGMRPYRAEGPERGLTDATATAAGVEVASGDGYVRSLEGRAVARPQAERGTGIEAASIAARETSPLPRPRPASVAPAVVEDEGEDVATLSVALTTPSPAADPAPISEPPVDPLPAAAEEVSTAAAPVERALPGGVVAAVPTAARSDAESLPEPAPLEAPPTPEGVAGTAPLPVAQPVAATAPPRPADPMATYRVAVASARARVDRISTYQLAMSRQERVGAKLQEAENVLLSVRRNPRAVRIEWHEGPHKGREVLFHDGKNINVHAPGTLMPRVSVPANSPLALKNSRHPIQEAGLDVIVEQLEQTLRELDAGTLAAAQVAYGGIEAPEAGGPPCHKLVRTDANGETAVVYLDTTTDLPYLVHRTDGAGQLLEHYVFRNVQPDLGELSVAEAFDPIKRWGPPKGLFGRIARGAGNGRGEAADAADSRVR